MRIATWIIAFGACACMCGCTSIYHVKLNEMTQSSHELLITRMTEARGNHVNARKAFEAAYANLTASDTPYLNNHEVDVSLDRISLETWNLGRRIASVHDVLELEEHQAAHNTEIQRLRRQSMQVLEQMNDLLHQMQHIQDGYRLELALRRGDIDSGQIRLQDEPARISNSSHATLISHIDAVTRSLDETLANLLDEPTMFAMDQGRGRAVVR